MVTCDASLTEEKIDEDPLFGSVTFHHIGLIVSAIFGLLAVFISLFLIYRHATHYSKPWQQKHIIRILFMIPIYATVSFLSYYKYRHSIYYEVLRDCYEAFAISSFFTLLCHYIAENLHDQKEYFRSSTPKNWLWPMTWCQKCTGGTEKGVLRIPRSGLTWFNIIWIGVFQYCLIRVFFTIVSVISEAFDRYCESSLSPAFAHIWVMVFETLSVTVAMYCLIQFYYQLKDDLAQYRPFLKVLCIKLVIFFSFWQTLLVSFLVGAGAIKVSKTLAYPDIKIGIPSMALCIEMAIFAVMHMWAFSWKEYDILSPANAGIADSMKYQGGRFGIKAYMDAFNPWDIIKASARGFRWLFVGVRKRHLDASYQSNTKLSKINSTEEYNGPTFAGNGEPAVATPSYRGKPPRYGDAEDDRSGLLSNAQHSPYADASGDLGVYQAVENPDSLPQNPTPSSQLESRKPAQPSPYGFEETAYHGREPSPPGMGGPRYYAAVPNPPQQQQQQNQAPYPGNSDWDMFAGVSQHNNRAGRPER